MKSYCVYLRTLGNPKDENVSLICLISSLACIAWTALFTHTAGYNADWTIPLATLVLMTVPRGKLLRSAHPFAVVLLSSGIWWLISGVYSLFFKGIGVPSGIETIVAKQVPYQDIAVSFWNQSSIMLPILNFILLCIPLPVMALSYLRRHDESEDLMFMLSAFSCITLFGGQIWSIRMLGLVGAIYGLWWCYDLSLLQQKSNALI